MQTGLPDLPFTNYGKAELRHFGTHSTPKATPRTYPETDLKTLTLWTFFPNDIHQAIQSATVRAHLFSNPFPISAWWFHQPESAHELHKRSLGLNTE